MSQGALQRNFPKKGDPSKNELNDDGAAENQHYENDSGKKKVRRYCVFFRRGKCSSGENCKYLHTAAHGKSPRQQRLAQKEGREEDHELELNDAEEEDGEGNNDEDATKRSKSKKVCVFYRRNNCKFGDACKYLHPTGGGNKAATIIQPTTSEEARVATEPTEGHDPTKFRTKPCRFFRRGHCNTGDACPFLHVRPSGKGNPRKINEPFFQPEAKNRGVEEVPQIEADAGGDHQVKDEVVDDPDLSKYKTKPCRYFRRGKCNSGDGCKFLHAERVPKHPHGEPSSEVKQATTKEIPEVPDSRIRTKPCTYFRRGHCRAGDDCLFLHAPSGSEAKTAHATTTGTSNTTSSNTPATTSSNTTKSKKSKSDGKEKGSSASSLPTTFTIFSTSSDKKRSKEIQFPREDCRVDPNHEEDLDPYVILVSWEIHPSEFPNHATIKRGLHDIFVENLGFYETNSSTVLEADVANLCSLLEMKPSEDVHKVIPVLRARLNTLIDAGLKPNNGLYGDFNAAAVWLNTIYQNECDSMPTSPKEEAAPLVMYFARRPAVFAV